MSSPHTLKRGRGSSDETVSDEVEVDGEHGAAVTDELVFKLKLAVSKVTDELRRNEGLLSSRDKTTATLKNEIEALKEKNAALMSENEELKGGQAVPDSQATLPSQDEGYHEEQIQRLVEDQQRTREQRLQDGAQNHAATLDKLDKALSANERLRTDILHLTEKILHEQEAARRVRVTKLRELQDANQAQADKIKALKQGLREMLGDASATENRSGGDNCHRLTR
jgi:superfamily I DNA/RNA helicase